MKEEGLALKGVINFKLFDKNGKLKLEKTIKNIIVYTGNDLIRKTVGQSSGQPVGAQWIAIGSGTTAPTGADTALETELDRKAATYAEQETVAGYKDQWTEQVTFGAGEGTGNVSESGCLNAAAAGTLLCRQTFTAIPKGASDSLQVTWTFTITNP